MREHSTSETIAYQAPVAEGRRYAAYALEASYWTRALLRLVEEALWIALLTIPGFWPGSKPAESSRSTRLA